jgi:hypothetical protein
MANLGVAGASMAELGAIALLLLLPACRQETPRSNYLTTHGQS